MKFLLVIDDYMPESTRVGAKMFHELAVQLVKNGHEVTVLTPRINQKKKLVISLLDGVTIWNFKSGRIKDAPFIIRGINESVLSYRAWASIKPLVNKNTFDGIIYYSPSIFFGRVIKKLKTRIKCKSYLVLRDIFPQWAIDSGLLKPYSPITLYFKYFEKVCYEHADYIGLMSQANIENFKGKNKSKCEVLYNWADTSIPTREKQFFSIRDKYNLQNKVVFFYGGNIGHAQDMGNLIRLAKNMHHMTSAHFLFIGQGDEVELIIKMANGLNLENFTYIPSVNQQHYREILTEVDIGLFSLAYTHTFHNFPGKLLSYMAYSLPILGSVNPGNDLINVINNHEAGLITINGQDDLLYENAMKLLSDHELRERIGMSGRKLLIKKFSVKAAASLIERKFQNESY
ncbi:TPA: glycosyltransferase family 4 protein [Citrobacter sedlakii]